MNEPVAPQEIDCEATYVAPWSRSRTEIVIPERFSAAIGEHLRVNLAETAAKSRAALILGVQGPAGEGKTEMVVRCCAHVGCNVFHLSAAALSGKHEGDARQALLRSILTARRVALTNDRPSVVVLDDLDRGVASLDERTGHTVNSGLLVGALQNLANDTQAASGGMPHARVPIIMTANSLDSLPTSLVRPGRMRILTWQPTWQEKASMALPLFGARTPLECARLRLIVLRYHRRGQPLAFFAQLAHEYVAASAPWPAECTDVLEAAQVFTKATASALAILDFGVLRRLARRLHRAKAQSFLKEGRCHV